MSRPLNDAERATPSNAWLTRYYAVRAVFSIVWVVVAVTVGPMSTVLAGLLLVLYPAWDAIANVADARRNGGVRSNATQTFNAAVSAVTTVAVLIALTRGMHAVIGVIGVWAALSGLLQLATAVRRWKRAGGQWVMVISGAQSAAAGAAFLRDARGTEALSVAAVAPYAAFGAFYFLVSAVWLSVSTARRRREIAAARQRR